MMDTDLYRLVYCSRNQIRGKQEEIIAEIQNILAVSRKSNPPAGLTGALLFNEGLFAQVLEGPVESVDGTFERIQRDPRHSDVTVLQYGPTDHRDFPAWSMAFAASSNKESALQFALPQSAPPQSAAAVADSSEAGKQVLKLLRDVVVQEDWIMA
jgi:blue light- and temperature-responsive anti-repressor